AIVKEDATAALLSLDEILGRGFDGNHFIGGLAAHFRNLLVAKEPATLKLLETSDTIKQRYLQQSQQVSAGLLLSALNMASQCEINYRTTKNQRLQVELSLLKMFHIATAINLARLGDQISGKTVPEKKKPDADLDQDRSTNDNKAGKTIAPGIVVGQVPSVNGSASAMPV